MKLGQKVKCKGYLKKNKLKYAVLKKDYDENFTDNIICLDFDDVVTLHQEIYSVVSEDFRGVLVGTRNVYILMDLEIEENYFNGKEFIKCTKYEPIKCAKVYYAMGKSRLVPLELVEAE